LGKYITIYLMGTSADVNVIWNKISQPSQARELSNKKRDLKDVSVV